MGGRAQAAPPVLSAVDGAAVVHAICVRGVLRLALSVAEVAELLFGSSDRQCCKRILALVRTGELPAASTGRAYLIPADSVLAFLGRSAAA